MQVSQLSYFNSTTYLCVPTVFNLLICQHVILNVLGTPPRLCFPPMYEVTTVDILAYFSPLRRVLRSEHHRYTIALPDELGTSSRWCTTFLPPVYRAHGFSVANVIDTQLRCLMNSALARWCMTVLMEPIAESGEGEWSPVSKHQIQPGCGD